MRGRFVCAVAWAAASVCGCNDFSSQHRPREPGSDARHDDAAAAAFESDPVDRSTAAKADEPVLSMIRLSKNSMKGPDCVALSRQANYFHWGFSVPPSQMTDSARRLFVNAICYIRKFNGAQPLMRKSTSPREWALRNAKLPEMLTDQYRTMKSQQIRDMIAISPGSLPEKHMGEIDQFIADQLNWVEPEMKRVLPGDLCERFGNNVSEWRTYYRDNFEYLRQGDDPSCFIVDEDVAALKISNRDAKLLEHCIGLLERQEGEALANRLLQRYTGMTFDTPPEWRAWFVQHKDRLYFSDSAGYQFRVRPD